MRPYVITEDGSYEPFKFKGEKPTLKEMQRAVKGSIEHVYITIDGMEMFVNDEGKIMGMDTNWIATELMKYSGDTISGPALVISADLVD